MKFQEYLQHADYGKMKNKKAQMKIQQMAFMLIAVTIFFVLAGMFALVIIFSQIRAGAELVEDREAHALVSRLANSPEFSCVGQKENCVDFDKLMTFVVFEHNKAYSRFWGFSSIEIEKVYPAQEGICDDHNYPNCGKIIVLGSPDRDIGLSSESFVSLCRTETTGRTSPQEVCEIARLKVYYRT